MRSERPTEAQVGEESGIYLERNGKHWKMTRSSLCFLVGTLAAVWKWNDTVGRQLRGCCKSSGKRYAGLDCGGAGAGRAGTGLQIWGGGAHRASKGLAHVRVGKGRLRDGLLGCGLSNWVDDVTIL